jgi:hypothetical protein
VKTIITAVAVAAVTAMIIVAGGAHSGPTRAATPLAARVVVRTTTTQVPAPTPTTVTHAAAHRGRSSAAHSALPVHSPARPHIRAPKAGRVTPTAKPLKPAAPPSPEQLAAWRTQLLKNCLDLSRANHDAVVAANGTWYRQQLNGLKGHGPKVVREGQALQLEEQQAQLEIGAQYTIDVSNCYLKDG